MGKQRLVEILLVEDDEGHADLVRLGLERSGMVNEIRHFRNGQEIAEFLFRGQMDPARQYLVLLDINMPGLDGYQVLGMIKGDLLTRKIPVIMLTTAEDERQIERCYALGCNLYLTKPLDYEEFAGAMKQLGLFIQEAKFPGVARLVA